MIVAIAFFILGIFILYIIIETAVRKGINSSVLGEYLEKELKSNKKKSFLDDDLDND
jgi:hypothetical protein